MSALISIIAALLGIVTYLLTQLRSLRGDVGKAKSDLTINSEREQLATLEDEAERVRRQFEDSYHDYDHPKPPSKR